MSFCPLQGQAQPGAARSQLLFMSRTGTAALGGYTNQPLPAFKPAKQQTADNCFPSKYRQ